MTISKPMLAVSAENLDLIKFPVIVSPKLDGIRCLKVDGKAVSRTFKPIPNKFIRDLIEYYMPDGVDGEIMIPGADFNGVQSAVMSFDGEPEFEYHVFDYMEDDLNKPFNERIKALKTLYLKSDKLKKDAMFLKIVPQIDAFNVKDLLQLENKYLVLGYEGIMVRDPNGPYKCGRSTLNEGYLLKVKRFKDAEARIYGFTERMHNANEAFKDELGRTKRSSKQENMVPTGILGALQVVLPDGKMFEIGTGFDDVLRKEIWDNQANLNGKYVKFKYQELNRETGIPRFPVFLGWRHINDIT